MATPCNEKFAICDEVIVEQCQRIEITRSRKTSGENTAVCTTVSSAMAPISRTELQDLPIEVLDYILMKAVVKKVIDRKLVKSVWLDYASRVIQPMRTVWSRWNYSLRTNWFRIVLSRILNNKDLAAISIAAISVASVETGLYDVIYHSFAKLGNQIYLTCTDDDSDDDDSDDDSDDGLCYSCYLMVFEVQDLLHCTKAIPLLAPKYSRKLAACEQSNSIYIWGRGPDVLHLVPDGNEGFEVLYWPPYSAPSDFLDGSSLTDNNYCISSFSVLDDGNLIVQRTPNVGPYRDYYANVYRHEILSVHRPDGFVVWNIKLPNFCHSSNVMMKSNGHFVYAGLRDGIVTEVDRDGKAVRNSHWKGGKEPYKQLLLDSCDRAILLDGAFDIICLDAELNFICKVPSEVELAELSLIGACFCKTTNELIIFSGYGDVVFVKLAL